jgi:molecular chaperone DnaJ
VCPKCNGNGKIAKQTCKKCKGSTYISSNDTLEIKLPKDLNSGETLRVDGKGNFINGKKGSLYVTVNFVSDRYVKRGLQLLGIVDINPLRALIGGKQTVDVLGNKVDINISPSTSSGEQITVKNKGFSKGLSKGDLILEVKIVSPKKIDSEARKELEKWVDKI